MTYKDLISRFSTAATALPFDVNFGFGTASQLFSRKNFSMPAIWVEPPPVLWDFTNGTMQLNETFQCQVHVLYQDSPDPKKPLRNESYSFTGDDTATLLDDAFGVAKQYAMILQNDNDDFEISGNINPTPFVRATAMILTGFMFTVNIRPLTQDDTYCEC